MVPINTGIDGMSLTFAPTSPYSDNAGFGLTSISSLFPTLTPEMFQAGPSSLQWYRDCLTLRSTLGTTLMQYHCNSTANYGKRDLFQINGLCFSDSALNPLRPLNLGEMFYWANMHDAHVSKFDIYLDDFTAAISQERLNEMSQPHTFDSYIQSPFLKARDGEKPEPRHYKGTWYYGQPKRNACEITTYNKGISPRQKIHSKANPLKFTWQRYELRFAGDTAKRLGKRLITDLVTGANLNACITGLFRKYLRFVEPQNSKRQSSWPLQDWYSNLLNLADEQPPVVLSWEPSF